MSQIWQKFMRKLRHFREDADLEDELVSHLDMQTEDNVTRGMTDIEAQRRARLTLGRTRGIIEAVRDGELITFLEGWYQDFVFALRTIRKEPVFCLTAILTLGLGIGANAAIFSLLYGLLLRSLPVPNPSQLAHIHLVSAANGSDFEASLLPYQLLERYKSQQHSFEEISAWSGYTVTMQDREGTLRLYTAGLASGNAFRVLAITPYIGRLIALSDDVRGGPPDGWPVVLSYGFWNDQFARDPHIIGRQLKISGIPVTVIGVTPREFRSLWPGNDIKLYFPLQFETALAGKDEINSPASFYVCSAVGRLWPGVSMRDANSELVLYQQKLLREFIPLHLQQLSYYRNASLRIDSARSGLPTYFGHVYSEPLYLMQTLVAVVLLLCCVNVGGLMMSKVYARQHEFAVRTAIGAARWRLVRQYLTESFVIALAGAALGAMAAWYSSGLLLHFFRDPNFGEPPSIRPDKSIFEVSAAFTVVTAFAFGMLPAWRVGKANPGRLLKSRSAVGRGKQLAGRAFVPLQVALSLVLVTLAALLSQSLIHLRTERTGFDLDRVTIQTPTFDLLPQKGGARLDLYQRMVDRIEQMPGIRSAAVTWYTPMTGIESNARFEAAGAGPNQPVDSHMAYNDVGPGYFRTMGTRILSGREFERNERTCNVCILNRSAASYLFPHQQALGQYVRSTDKNEFTEPIACRIIGIAEDAKFASLRKAPPRTLYFPLTKTSINDAGNLVFLINSANKAEAMDGYRKALQQIAPTIPLVLFATLRDQMDAALGSQRLVTVMSNFFGGLALFLSALGLYGLLSSSVVQRRGEIGVRMALGARRGSVIRMVLFDALKLLGSGVLLGTGALLFAVRFVSGMLYHVPAFSPVIFLGTLAVLAGVTLLAGIIPALRAGSVDPIEALRSE